MNTTMTCHADTGAGLELELACALSNLLERAEELELPTTAKGGAPTAKLRWIQRALNRILGTSLQVTGVIDKETQNAISAFQRKKGLPQTGAPGPETDAAGLFCSDAFGGAGVVVRPGAECGLFGTRTIPVTHVVLHTIAGSYESALNAWAAGSSCYMPHYAIKGDGTIAQIVPETMISAHANKTNPYSIGIEHDGFADDPCWYNDTLYRDSARLVRDICARHKIPVSGSHIIGHDDALGTGHGDPGGYWDWDYFLALVRSKSGQVPLRRVADQSSPDVTISGRSTAVPRGSVQWVPGVKHSWGKEYRILTGSVGSPASAVFKFENLPMGNYDIAGWWPIVSAQTGPNARAPTTKIHVYATSAWLSSGSRRKILETAIDQRDPALRSRKTRALPRTPQWASFGRITAMWGDTLTVELTGIGTASIVADAIRLLRIP